LSKKYSKNKAPGNARDLPAGRFFFIKESNTTYDSPI
jgi:hypothetical protein